MTSTNGGGMSIPVNNAKVIATVVTTGATVADCSGRCCIEIHAIHTGTVTVTVTAPNQPTTTGIYKIYIAERQKKLYNARKQRIEKLKIEA